MKDIQLVDLPEPKDFKPGRDPYPENAEVIIYETSWVSHTFQETVVYVGSHLVKSGSPIYWGSGQIVIRAKNRYGEGALRFRILEITTINDRWTRENEYIQEYISKYGKRCRNLRLNGNGGGSIWTQEMKAKFKSTSQARFGVDHPFQSEEVKEKLRATHQERLGVNSPMQSEMVKEKSRVSCLKTYGVENVSQANSVKAKKSRTMKEHFGVDHYMQSDEGKAAVRQTMLERYGVERYSMTDECKRAMKLRQEEKYRNGYSTKQTRPVKRTDPKTKEEVVFPSAAAAAFDLVSRGKIKSLQSGKTSICYACKGTTSQAYGYHWSFID